MKRIGRIELCLFASDSLISARTVFQWLELLEEFPKDAYVLRVRDVTPESTTVTQAELDSYGVSFTPCMVARGNGKTARIIGDLSTSAARATAVSRLRAIGLVKLSRDQAAS
jgi:hypothetical protein